MNNWPDIVVVDISADLDPLTDIAVPNKATSKYADLGFKFDRCDTQRR